MQTAYLFTAIGLVAFAAANPLPADGNVAITDSEWSNLHDGGLQRREAQTADVNQPITDDEWQNLKDGGLTKRDISNPLVARDKVMNCGHTVKGNGGSGGHGKWVPVTEFATSADTFCQAYTGTDISLNHETSDTYPINLTNQGDDSQPGPAGNIVFAIYNTARTGSYLVDHDTCLRAMKAPLGNNISKRDATGGLEKRDWCYGSTHKDYEGGYYMIDGIGAFGSEVYGA